MRIRLGAVAYLNARPLTYGWNARRLFDLRFDPPSQCAELLHAGTIDVGMIPSIEYCRGRRNTASCPGWASSRTATSRRWRCSRRSRSTGCATIAADTSSRTSNGLLRILCAERFGIEPEFRPMAPNPAEMFAACDAALIIGDPALYWIAEAHGVQKIDLGAEWTAMTGLPFVWAFWAGRPGVLDSAGVSGAHRRARPRRRGVRCNRRRLLRPRASRAGPPLSEGQYLLPAGRARRGRAAPVLRARRQAWPDRCAPRGADLFSDSHCLFTGDQEIRRT